MNTPSLQALPLGTASDTPQQAPNLKALLEGENWNRPQKDYDRKSLLPYLEANEPAYLSSLPTQHYSCIKGFCTTARTVDARYLIARLYETKEFQQVFLRWYNNQPDYTTPSA